MGELITLLNGKELPASVFATLIFLYFLSTAKWATKIPGALGALARYFENRNVKAVEKLIKEDDLSDTWRQKQIGRLNETLEDFRAKLADQDNRITALERENGSMRETLYSAVNFIRLLRSDIESAGTIPIRAIPDILQKFFNNHDHGVAEADA